MGFTLGTVFNEGTDWEFTVSNETLGEVVQGGGITEADIADYCYVALIDSRVVAMIAESSRNSNDGLYPWASEYCAAYNSNNGGHPSKVQMNIAIKEQYPVTCYQRNIITYYGTIGGKTGHFLVMDMADIKKWIMDYDVYPAYNAGTVTSTAGFPGYSGSCYVYNEANVARISAYQAVDTLTESLFLMNVFTAENTIWIGSLNPTAHSKELLSNEKLSHAAFEFDYAAGDIYNTYYTGYIYQGGSPTLQGWSNFPDAQFPDPSGNTTIFASYLECDDNCDSIIYVSGQYGNSQNPYITNCEQGKIIKTLHGLHTVESWGGLLFKDNNVIYKPIIEGGVVTGFTSDMDIPSEWDDMTNVTGNNISPTPPTPTPSSDDDIDEQQIGSGTGLGGVSNLWLLTEAQMSAFHNAMNSADWDVMSSIISVMGLGIPPIKILTDIEVITNIVLKKSDGTTWSSGVNGHICTSQKSSFNYPAIKIQRKYNDFRDFSPYATHEIFVPMCGWFTLPDIAVERGCKVSYVFDIENCKIRGIVDVDGCIVGERDGIMGCSVSLSNTGHALYVNSAIVNASNAVGSGISLLTGGSVQGFEGAAMMGLSGLSQSVGNAIVNDRINRTESMVGNGARTGFSDGEWILVKSTYTNSDEDPLYAHTVGYPCNKSGLLSTFHGFTKCINPHIHISASSREKEEIKQLLEQGVILPSS
jgi:hypothetical protein